MSQSPKNSTQRTFILGDSWLYYKLYTGHKTADHVITDCLFPLAEKLRSQGLIEKWFFIRYHDDAGAHLRFRMEMLKPEEDLAAVIMAAKEAFNPLINIGWIWKIQTDTYQRELERYGLRGISISEELFFQNSHLTARLIGLLNADSDEITRWLFCLPAIDQLFNSFEPRLENKHALMEIISKNFAAEFGMNASLRSQLDEKYEREKSNIAAAMTGQKLDAPVLIRLQPCLQLLQGYQDANNAIAQNLLELRKSEPEADSLNNLIASHIHMLVNRLFKSKQRVHEMVIYDFLTRYYKSLLPPPEKHTRVVKAEAEKLLIE